ncbi:MAG: hypothetical protein ACFFF4_02145 [Candidatus Thorarchaeota archaeon]
MDFTLSVTISGIISTILVLIALVVYYRRYREISPQLTAPTRKALSAFGIAVFFLALVGPTGLLISEFSMMWIACLFAAIIIAQLNLAMDDEKKVRRISVALIAMALVTMLEAFARVFIPSYPTAFLTMMLLATMMVGAIIGSVYVLRESPSPFTVSMFIIIIFTLISAFTASTGFIVGTPQFFILQIMPIVVAAGVVGSMLRPWRNIITLTMLGLIVTAGPSLFIPAFIAGDTTIFLFTVSLTFALISLTIPLSFFLQQAVDTRATTALYISISLISIGLMALTHGNNFSIANSYIGSWDELILFMDWGLGLIAVGAFTMAAIAASFSSTVRHASREFIIAFGFTLLTLGMPFVRWVEVGGELIQRWELDPLYLGVFALLLISFSIFGRLSYQLYKAGAGRAGLRFIFFMFAALFLGIVAMFSDNIPLDYLVPMLLLAGVMLIFSSPRRNPFAQA